MATRKVSTPGEAPKPEEVKATEATQPTTAEQADAALESITGADPSTNENAPEVALVPVEQFDAVAQKRGKRHQHAFCRCGLQTDHELDIFQRVEQKMRSDA